MDKHRREFVHAIIKRFVLPETTLLVALCTWDTLYTLYCVRTGIAREANPALKSSLDHSNTAFLLLKGATFLVPVAVLELIRSFRPQLVSTAMRVGFIAYFLVYMGGSFALMGSL